MKSDKTNALTPTTKKVSFIAVVLLMLAVVVWSPASAFANSAFDQSATESYSYSDVHTGNMFLLDHSVSNTDISRDLYWAGQSFEAEKLKVGSSGSGSILLAGQIISLKNATVANSLRAAGYNIAISGVSIGDNVTAAGYMISLDATTKANGVYLAGSELSVSGSYNGASLAGQKVVFNGTVEGDLTIDAAEIEIGSNAVVKGVLTVPDNANVTVADAAQIATTEKSNSMQQAQEISATDAVFQTGLQLLFSCLAHIILVGLFFWLMKGTLFEAARMSEGGFGKIMLTGCIIFFVAPLLMFILILPLVTIPVVVLMALAMIAIWLFSIPFAGSALGMRFFKGVNPLLSAMLGTIILTIFCYVLPFMMIIVPMLCSMYTAGYFGQKFLTERRVQKGQNKNGPFDQSVS